MFHKINFYLICSFFFHVETFHILIYSLIFNIYLLCAVILECNFLNFFRQEDLFRLLKAYTIHNPQDGYCQAQGPLAAVLLMHMPAEEAFWCFVSICDKYLPGYYSTGLVCYCIHCFR